MNIQLHPSHRSTHNNKRHLPLKSTVIGLTGTLALCGSLTIPAYAATGDISNASGTYLGGSLLHQLLTVDQLASLGGETATSNGTTTDTQGPSNLNLTALSILNLKLNGGITLPLKLTDAGVVTQYAQARNDGSSTGASGLVTSDGAITVAGTDSKLGDLHLNLGTAVDSLTGLGDVTNQLADLDLTVGATGATATQAAPAKATGDYTIADLKLSFTSPVLAALVSEVNKQVGTVQTLVNGLAGENGSVTSALTQVLSGITGGVLDTTVNVGQTDLQAGVTPLLTGTLSDDKNYPGVSVNLANGQVTVDLAKITTLEDLAPNTDVLTDQVITTITNSITGLVTTLLTQVQDKLNTLTNNIDLNVAVTLNPLGGLLKVPGTSVDVVKIDSTVGKILAGDTSGVSILGAKLAGVPGLDQIVGALGTPLKTISDTTKGITTAVLNPVVQKVVPAVKPVLDAVVDLTANNQTTSSTGVFSETALRATVLPGVNALTLDVANATVGPNSVAPAVTSLNPTEGPETGGTEVTVTGQHLTGATGVTFDGTQGTSFKVVNDTTIKVTTPAHNPGAVNVVVQSPNGNSTPTQFTYTATPQQTTPAPAVSGLAQTGSGGLLGGLSLAVLCVAAGAAALLKGRRQRLS